MTTIRLPNNWRPRDYQMPAWSYLEGSGKHAELVWHRRSGKDDMCLHRTAVAMFERPGNYWHMLPKANQARKALWEAVNPHSGKRRIDEAFPEGIRAGQQDHEMMIRAKNGSTWQVVGSDNFDALVGSPPVGLVFSEWPLSDPSSWAYLRPIMAENNGWVIFNGTPRGRNHAYRTFRASQKTPSHFAQILPATETNVFSPEKLESERRELIAEYGPDYGQAKFEQEYLCSFDAANLGAILGRWLQRAHTGNRITADVFDPLGAPIEISSDIGFRDTAAWWFWQPRSDGFGVIDYLHGSGMEASDWIGTLQAHCEARNYRLGCIWLPQDAKAKTFGSRHSPMEQFLEGFGSDKVRLTPPTKVLDRVNAARTVIELCHFDDEATSEGREALAAWQFEYDEERKEFSKDPRHDWASHGADAFSYGSLVMREREIEEKKANVIPVGRGGPMIGKSLDEMWAENPRRSARI